MALTIDYVCQKCGDQQTNQEMSSMVCTCGGDYRPNDMLVMQQPVFDAHLCPVTGKYLTSYSQQEKAGREYCTPQHPTGLRLVNDNKKFLQDCKNIHRHRIDYMRTQYAKNNEDPGSAGRHYRKPVK